MPALRTPPALPDLPARPALATLIESCAFPHQLSLAGTHERYQRGKTPHTIHVWWARRPHAAMRALLFACLYRDDEARGLALMQQLAAPAPDADTMAAARARVASAARAPSARPRVLDMFGGGGTIAFEAARLGAEAHSVDVSALSVFLQRSLLVHARAVPRARLLDALEDAGQRVLARLAADSAPLFPRRSRITTYFWSYSLTCAGCGYRMCLRRRPWLARRGARRVGLRIEVGAGDRGAAGGAPDGAPSGMPEGAADRVIVDTDMQCEPLQRWVGRGRSAACPGCGHLHQGISMDSVRDELLAVAVAGKDQGQGQGQGHQGTTTTGRWYETPAAQDQPCEQLLRALEAEILDQLGQALPDTVLPCWSGVVNPPLHGLVRHADLPNPRQRVVLLLLVRALHDEHARLRQDHGVPLARAVISLLGGLVDQLVDWNCRLSMWIPQNEQVGRAFCGPGIAMLWDYAETDPVGAGPSNLHAKLARILAGARALLPDHDDASGPCQVHHGRAQALPFAAASFDAVVTDPPYYDNLVYSALADCFLAWKRLLPADIEPALGTGADIDPRHELVASTRRHGSAARAHAAYCEGLHQALCEAERVLVPGGVLALVYSHAAMRGWQALVHAYRPTGLVITRVQPLRVERRQRPRAMRARAVHACVVLVARQGPGHKPERGIDDIAAELRECCLALQGELETAGWGQDDMGLVAFAQGVALLANARRVHGAQDDLEALRHLATTVRAIFPGFAMTERTAL